MRASSRLRKRNRLAIAAGRRQVQASHRQITRAAVRRPARSRGGDAGRVAAVKVRLATRDQERRRSGARNARQVSKIARDTYATSHVKHSHPSSSVRRGPARPMKARHAARTARRPQPRRARR